MQQLIIALLAILGAGCMAMETEQGLEDVVLAGTLDPETAALLIVRLEDGERWSSGGRRLPQRFSPASTSKIPHSLMALETGVVNGPDHVFRWDGRQRFVESWNEDQTFADAFQRSTVWVYQQITPQIGSEALAAWFEAFGYGNADTGPPHAVDMYWLTEPLAISVEEQVGFLARLARRELPLSVDTYETALPMMIEAEGNGWRMYAKTGWWFSETETDIGWYVGWLERVNGASKGTYVFAFNLDMPDPDTQRQKRRDIVWDALRDIGALPDG